MDFSYIKHIDIKKFLELRYDMLPKRQTADNLFYICPWHNDTDASLCFCISKSRFKCFGCDEDEGSSGDIIDFVGKMENMTFQESCKIICRVMGLNEPLFKKPNPFHLEYIQMMSNHAMRYHANLSKDIEAYSYLANDRKITIESIQTFMLGVTDKNEYKYRSDLGGISHRISFPILEDCIGKRACVGMGYRTLHDETAKYINDQTQNGNVAINQNPNYAGAFEKGNHLFGYYQAKKSIAETKSAILVEGYLDVVSLHQARITNVMGLMGTALTEAQVQKISCKNVLLLLDGDEAGIKAMKSNIAKLLKFGKHVSICVLPNGMDPSDLCIKKKFDYEQIFDVIKANSIFGVTFLINESLQEYEEAVIKKQNQVLSQLQPVLNEIQDENLKKIYCNMLYKRLNII